MAPETLLLTRDVETLGAESSPTADQEKQLLRERDHDQDHAVPHTDPGREQRRTMASGRGFLLALLVCCFITLGLASAKSIHAGSDCHDNAGDAQHALVDVEHPSLSSLLGSSEIRGLLEKFHVPHAKRQASNDTTTASSLVTPATTDVSSAAPTVAVSSSSAEQQSSTVDQQTTPSTLASTAASTIVDTSVQSTTTTATAQATSTATPTTPSETIAASSASATNGGTTLVTQSPSKASNASPGSTASTSLSSKLVTATLTSTLPDGGISVVTQTSYSYVNAQHTGSSTTPEASLQTNGAVSDNFLAHGAAIAVGGFCMFRNLY